MHLTFKAKYSASSKNTLKANNLVIAFRIKAVFFSLLIFFFNSLVQAQFTSKGDFDQITVKDGLNNSVVYKILKDKQGFLWFATNDGLNKYDGINITKYSLSKHSYLNAGDNNVLCIVQTKKSHLYCGTSNGHIYSYKSEIDKFEKININGVNPLKSEVYCLHLVDSSKLLVGSSNGLYYLNLIDETIQLIGDITKVTRSIFHDRNNNYWIGTLNDLYKGSLTFTDSGMESNFKLVDEFKGKIVFSINQDSLDRVWLGTQKDGVFLYDYKSQKFSNINKVLLEHYKHLVPVRSIHLMADKVILGLDGWGLCVLNDDHSIKHTYYHLEDVSSSLSNNGVYDILFDQKNLWIATYGGGVNKLNLGSKGFRIIAHEPNNDNSLKNNTARSFIETDDGKLWFGTKKGISISNPVSGKWKHINFSEDAFGSLVVLDLFKCKNGDVLAATFKNGLYLINPQNYKFKNLQLKDVNGAKVGTNYAYAVIEDKQGLIWSGGIRGNLSVYNPQTKIARDINISNIKVISESYWGTIYVGTTDGLYQVDPVTLVADRIKPYNVLQNQNRVYTIFCDTINNNKLIWLGTEGGGLLRLDLIEQNISILSENDGLPSNFIYGILKDNNGLFWLSTTNGICSLNPETKAIIVYNYSDGLSNQEFNFGAYGRTKEGGIVFGGQNGFTYFKPENLVADTIIPRLVLNSFKLFGKEQTINNEESPLKKHINFANAILLKHNQNSVSFGYAAINFTNPFKVLYRYKLEGFDLEWSGASLAREAIYTNLKPGEYTFRVKSSNHDGIWGNNERKVTFTIKPPFSRTLWAYLIYFTLFTGIATLLIQYFRSRAKERNALEKTRFFVNIAHDLRTPLTLVKAPLEQLVGSKKIDTKDKGSLLLAQKNVDRLNRLVTQLMDFQKADLNKMQFAPAKHFFIEFYKETTSSFLPLLCEKEIDFSLDIPDEDFEWTFDKNKIGKVIFNLMSNAIKYTPQKGTISLSAERLKDKLILVFEDTGIGIPGEQQKKIFTRYFRAKNVVNSQETGSGVGLMLVKKLVELHEGTIEFESIEGKGTTFKIVLPKKKFNQTRSELPKEEPAVIKLFEKEEAKQGSVKLDNRNHRILFVEDNNELRDYASKILSRYFEVYTAENGKEGLELAKSKHPDLIISDIMMPVMDGNQLCDKLKSNIDTCHLPVILLTALDTIEYKLEGLRVGADAYIEKPFDMSYLLARIKNLLKTRQQLKDKFAFYTEVEETHEMLSEMDSKLLDSAKTYILNNIKKQDLSVKMLAEELCMSRPVLYRKLKALTDQSPQDFIRLIRLVEAKKLLANKDKTVSDVAYETGFSDPKYFSTSFKKQFGCTPTQFGNSGA